MNWYLLPTIEFGPTVVRRIIDQIPPERWDEALVAGRFTPREVAAHLADWEPIMRDRIRLAAERPGTLVEVYDEEEMALSHGYSESNPVKQCVLFARERAITASYVRSLTAASLANLALHPERGEQSAADFANTLLGHDFYHVEQLSAYLKG